MKFVVFCPDNYTGGPFALLQLNSAINRLGATSEVLFYNIAKLGFDATESRVNLTYERKPNLSIGNISYRCCESFGFDDVLIFPEVLMNFARKFQLLGFENRVYWWLSWDNAPLKELCRLDNMESLLSCIHIFQSHYAQTEGMRFGFFGPIVSDYTVLENRESEKALIKKNDICFLPRKAPGADRIIKELEKNFSIIRIEGMSHDEVQKTLQISNYFIDFGHHPGKDRIPREAVMNRCVPLIRNVGAAKFIEDVFIPDFLKIDTEKILDSNFLVSRINYLNSNRQTVLDSLSGYQRRIRREYDAFNNQVSDFLSLYFGINLG